MAAQSDGFSATLGTSSVNSCESEPGVQEPWLGREGPMFPEGQSHHSPTTQAARSQLSTPV